MFMSRYPHKRTSLDSAFAWIGRCLPALFLCLGPTTVHAQSDAATIAFTGVNVLPMDREAVLENHTVLVRGSRIEAIGPAGDVEVPPDARVIDADNQFLLPGLAEMHGHIPSGDADPQYVADLLALYVANGVTTVRGMQGGPGQLELAQRVETGQVTGPTLYLAGPAFSGGSINSPEEATARVQAQKREGWHLLKVLPGLSRAEYDAMARTANALNIPFAGHVPAEVGLLHALEMHQQTFDHIDGYIELLNGEEGEIDASVLQGIVHRTREAGAWIVPTMAVWEVLLGALDTTEVEAYEELRYMPPAIRSQWIGSHRNRMSNPDLDRDRAQRIVENRQRILGALDAGGVHILMGTDSPQQFSVPGFAIQRELLRMRDAGMSPYAILRSGTFNVGEYFRGEDAFGIVAPGMRADLILIPENPLQDLRHLAKPSGVMVRGTWYDRAQLDSILQEIADRYDD